MGVRLSSYVYDPKNGARIYYALARDVIHLRDTAGRIVTTPKDGPLREALAKDDDLVRRVELIKGSLNE